MPTYTLTYFNTHGRGELIRLLFAAAGQKYNDIRVERADWPRLKPTTPFGSMPVLEVDGVRLCQSKTVARFLANRFGLAGKTDLDKARADMIVDCTVDIATPAMQFVFLPDKAKQAELRTKFVKETLPNYLAMLEKLLKENHGGDAFFVGDSMTWADIAFLDTCEFLTLIGAAPDLSHTPKLRAVKEKTERQPKIAEWFKNRPAFSF